MGEKCWNDRGIRRLMEPIVSFLKIMRTKKLAFEKEKVRQAVIVRKNRIKSSRNNWNILPIFLT